MWKISRFDFIEDIILREELDKIYDFIKTLLDINSKFWENENNFLMLNKTIVIYIWAIIESSLYYTLSVIKEKWIDKDKQTIDKKIRIEDKYRDEKLIYKINDVEDLVVCKKIKQFSWLDTKISFNSMIQVIKTIWLIDDSCFKSLELIRKRRNEIHIHTILDDKTVFSNDEMVDIYNSTSEILLNLENRLNLYNKN